MLTPIINVVLALTLAVSTAFGSLFAAYETTIEQAAVVSGGAVVTAEPATEGEYTTIQRGQSGEAVLALQERLSELGYYTGKLTGKMDSPTQLAYKKFEKVNGFDANGIASPEEQMMLFSEAAVAAE